MGILLTYREAPATANLNAALRVIRFLKGALLQCKNVSFLWRSPLSLATLLLTCVCCLLGQAFYTGARPAEVFSMLKMPACRGFLLNCLGLLLNSSGFLRGFLGFLSGRLGFLRVSRGFPPGVQGFSYVVSCVSFVVSVVSCRGAWVSYVVCCIFHHVALAFHRCSWLSRWGVQFTWHACLASWVVSSY